MVVDHGVDGHGPQCDGHGPRYGWSWTTVWMVVNHGCGWSWATMWMVVDHGVDGHGPRCGWLWTPVWMVMDHNVDVGNVTPVL